MMPRFFIFFIEAEDLVHGAAHLEGTGALQMLALEQETGARAVAENAGQVQRGLPRTALDRLDALIGGDDIGDQIFHDIDTSTDAPQVAGPLRA
jgi:hypothetical protein